MEWLPLLFVLLGYGCVWLSGWHLAFYHASVEWVNPDKKFTFRRRQVALSVFYLLGSFGWFVAAAILLGKG